MNVNFPQEGAPLNFQDGARANPGTLNGRSVSKQDYKETWKSYSGLKKAAIVGGAILFGLPIIVFQGLKFAAQKLPSLMRWSWKKISYAADKIYQHLLAPIGRAIGTALKFTFVTLPKTIWKGISYAADKIYQHLLAPIGRAIGTALKFTFVTLPKTIW
ncbi:MAG: hypothetical protein K0S07_1592, partial [Chlamydiales bacterium]|nr:hypothetical protein [Chlamydiales bacterium]